MKTKLTLILLFFCPIISSTVFAQAVETPDGPDLVDWQKDHERMKKNQVKTVRAYTLYGNEKSLAKTYQFDADGYVTNEITYSGGRIIDDEDFVYSNGHNAYSWYRMSGGKKYCARKVETDAHGYEIKGYYCQPDGSEELQCTYNYIYNLDGKVKEVRGKWYDQGRHNSYFYDATGKMTRVKDNTDDNPEWNWEYTYDSLDRLIKEYWWEKEGKDTSMVAKTYWTYGKDGKIMKEEGVGRGYNDIIYEWKNDTLIIDFKRGQEFGPSFKCEMQLSTDKGLVTHMKKFTPSEYLKEEYWYEYEFY